MKVRNGFVSNSSTTSFVVVGIPIPNDVLWKTKKIRTCRCKIKGVFCPKHGSLWTVDRPVPAKGFSLGEGFSLANGTFQGLGVCRHEDKWFAFAAKAQALDRSAELSLEDLVNVGAEKEKIRAVLEPLGLWQDASFKIWAGHEPA